MGIEYDLISDATREGYELGKGPWDDEFVEALLASDPAVALKAYLVEETLWERTSPGYLDEIVPEIIAFAKAHPDWRVINDAQSDISVIDDSERTEWIADGEDPDDVDFPTYRKVGSRYRATVVEPVPEVAIPPVDEATRKEVLDGMRGTFAIDIGAAAKMLGPAAEAAIRKPFGAPILGRVLGVGESFPIPRSPRRIRRQHVFGASVNQALLTGEIIFDLKTKLVPDRVLVPKGFKIVELSLTSPNEDEVILGFAEDCVSWLKREYVDDDDSRWGTLNFEPPVVEGVYDVSQVLPLLRHGDKIKIIAERINPNEQPFFAVSFFGDTYEEESDVEPWEIVFDSGKSVEAGASAEIRVSVDRFVRVDRLYVHGGPLRSKEWAIEQIHVGQEKMLAGSGPADLINHGMKYMPTVKLSAMLTVRNCGVMPRIFRGKLIGVAHKSIAGEP